MSMTKKDFIALADLIREDRLLFPVDECITLLADFCQSRNPAFDRERWLAYIAGKCGPNGGKAKQ